MRKVYVIAILVLFFSGYVFSVQKMERIVTDGKTILLPLAPVDPRALLMGDYMDLNYVVNGNIYSALRKEKATRDAAAHLSGLAVLRVTNVPVPLAADFVRLYDGKDLREDEFLLAYKLRGHRVISVASAFYFEEGSAKLYEQARFGLFKVADDGKTLLINLCDSQGHPIQYEKTTEQKNQP
ncbi:GDYXXLXY domain-containing protein [Desulfovibrio sp.]|uniref:GDYXXLXY domain-containing protein n=1 Tax=Desulfovibrio sp. TaxID=885 RepID=UPI0025C601C5|nr:GDYXXLXY domain-containing protein [Desulfovibrio sp.]